MLMKAFNTVRKLSLRRLCFHRCLSIHRGGVCPIACWDTYTPPDQRQTPPGQTPLPPGQTHPSAVHAGTPSTSGRYASHWNTFLLSYKLVLTDKKSHHDTSSPTGSKCLNEMEFHRKVKNRRNFYTSWVFLENHPISYSQSIEIHGKEITL